MLKRTSLSWLQGYRSSIGVFLFLLGIYGLTSSWQLYSQDEEIMLSTTAALAERGSFNLQAGDQPPLYSKYGPLQSIVAIPLFMLGKLWTHIHEPAATWLLRIPVSWLNMLVVAATASVLSTCMATLGYRRSAIWTALAYGLGSMAWVYSKTFFAEPLTSLLILLSLCLVLRARKNAAAGWQRYAFSGLVGGLAVLTKIHAATIILPLAVWFAASEPDQRRRATRIGAWVLGMSISMGLFAIYNWRLFGSPWSLGYGAEGENGFTHDLWRGIYGLTLSWGRGVFWYVPLLWLLPWALRVLGRQHRSLAWLIGGIFISQIVFYARWWAWDGAGSWGPRFLLIAMPLYFIALGGMFQHARQVRWARRLIWLLLCLTLPVQLAGLSISFNTYFAYQPNENQRNFVLSHSALVMQPVLAWRQLDHAYQRLVAPERVVLESGFSYSEGDRAAAELLPRWTLERALIRIRSKHNAAVTALLHSCGPNGVAVGELKIQVAETTLLQESLCPPRLIHIFVPTRAPTITLRSTPWNPVSPTVERDEQLGTYVKTLSAATEEGQLKVAGTLIPMPPMPPGSTKLRQWLRDYRLEHWDFWWWYLAHSSLSSAAKVWIAGTWVLVHSLWIGLGITLLRSAARQPAS